MIKRVKFFTFGETALHPIAEQISGREEIGERPSDRCYRDEERAPPESIDRAGAEAEHRTGQEKHTGEGVENDEPNPADGTCLLNPDHDFTHPSCPLIKHAKQAKQAKIVSLRSAKKQPAPPPALWGTLRWRF